MKLSVLPIIVFIVVLNLLNTSCQKQTDYTPQINSLQKQIDDLKAQQSVINSLQTSLLSLQKRCDSLSNALAITNSNLHTTNNNVTILNTTLTSLQTQVTTITGQITVLNTQLNSTNANIASITNQINNLNAQYITIIIQINIIYVRLGILPSSLKSGLIAWYPFDGNANDESGNNNNGINVGATLTTDRFGNMGKAYSFDGLSSYINYASGNASQLNVTGDISISFWFKTTQSTTGAIISFGDQLNSSGGYLAGMNEGLAPTGTLDYSIQTQSYNWPHSSKKLNDNNWHNAIITRNTTMLNLYIDGKLDNQVLNAPPALSWNGPRRIGVANYVLDGFYNGILDDMGIWNRALTQEEVTLLYITN